MTNKQKDLQELPRELFQKLVDGLNGGEFEKTLEKSSALLETFPKSSLIYMVIGNANIKLHQLDDAIIALQKSININPKNPATYINLGLAIEENGDRKEAIKCYVNAIRLDPKNLDAHFNLAVANHNAGDLALAIEYYQKVITLQPNHALAHNNLGFILENSGNFAKAIAHYQKAIKIDSTCFDAHNNLGNALHKKGQLQAAINAYTNATKMNPQIPYPYFNLGLVEAERDNLGRAIINYKKALKIKPNFLEGLISLAIAYQKSEDYSNSLKCFEKALKLNSSNPQLHVNLGIVHRNMGHFDDAVVHYNEAISIKPDYAAAYINLGNVLVEKLDIDNAIKNYNHALQIQPTDSDIYVNLGVAYHRKDQIHNALECYKKAIHFEPHHDQAYWNLEKTLHGVSFKRNDPDLNEIICKLMSKEKFFAPIEIVKPSISLLKLDPMYQQVLISAKLPMSMEKTREIVSKVTKIPLFIRLLRTCALPDLEIESILKTVRRSILMVIEHLKAESEIFDFLSALATQCYINEYIYGKSNEEIEQVSNLEKYIELDFYAGNPPNALTILILACFKSLSEYSWIDDIKDNDDLASIISLQCLNHQKEKEIIDQLPTLKSVSDMTSTQVQLQYERNPYPRWLHTRLERHPVTMRQLVEDRGLLVKNTQILTCSNPEVLIAGCGTGQHAIQVAAQLKNSKIVAIDLSRASLAYAQRKTKEYGLRNIEYLHADILDLEHMKNKFDIIECSGVLHHMKYPEKGWKILTTLLRPQGLMKIGLYSNLARIDVARARNEIELQGISSDYKSMIEFRNIIIDSNTEQNHSLTLKMDFYSTSEFRDLLFHVQEHRFTLPEIKGLLGDLELDFCGFEGKVVRKHFLSECSNSDLAYDLDEWNKFELKNPSTFRNMYEFWCQKLSVG